MYLGRGAVDLIGQDEVGEDGAFVGGEAVAVRVVDLGADEVGGQQVWRELDAGKLGADGLGHRFDEQRLGQPGHAFQQHVPICQQRHEEAGDEGGLADDLGGNCVLQLGQWVL